MGSESQAGGSRRCGFCLVPLKKQQISAAVRSRRPGRLSRPARGRACRRLEQKHLDGDLLWSAGLRLVTLVVA